MASCRSRRLAPASKLVRSVANVPHRVRRQARGQGGRESGGPAEAASMVRTSARYIRAPVPVANSTRRRAAAAVPPGIGGQRSPGAKTGILAWRPAAR